VGGGFYFDKPWEGADIGSVYLVFLNPAESWPGQPTPQEGAVFVNYSCGQSKPWTELSGADIETLRSIAARDQG
jgi:hypothetical protein